MEDRKKKAGRNTETHEKQESSLDSPLPESDYIARRTAKDSVFCDLFGNKKYLLQLYQALHPEDKETTEDDLTDISIRNVLTDGIYNDIGFRNKEKVIILAEAQSTWSVNILPRMLLYLAQTYHEYFRKKKTDLYSRTKADVPEAELYVIFTGERTHKPEYIFLSKEFFKGKTCSIEIMAKVLYGDESSDIISQYVTFSKVYTEQVKKYGYTREAVLETIRICRDKHVLTEYLKSRESEVVSIMMTLFDDEYIQMAYHHRLAKELREEMAAEVREEVTAEVREEVTAEVREEVTAEVRESAEKMLRSGRISMDEISEFFPQLASEDIKKLQQMV